MHRLRRGHRHLFEIVVQRDELNPIAGCLERGQIAAMRDVTATDDADAEGINAVHAAPILRSARSLGRLPPPLLSSA